MEVRAEGSRRGFSKLGKTRNQQSLPICSLHGKHQKCYRTNKSRERRSRPPPARKRTSRISARACARDGKPSRPSGCEAAERTSGCRKIAPRGGCRKFAPRFSLRGIDLVARLQRVGPRLDASRKYGRADRQEHRRGQRRPAERSGSGGHAPGFALHARPLDARHHCLDLLDREAEFPSIREGSREPSRSSGLGGLRREDRVLPLQPDASGLSVVGLERPEAADDPGRRRPRPPNCNE